MVTKIQQFDEAPTGQLDDEEVAYHQQFHEIPISGLLFAKYASADIWPRAVPSQLLLGSLRDGRLRLSSPITVKLAMEGQHIVAEAVDFNEFGFGENPSEALIDLQHAIIELYFTLEEEQHRLGNELQTVWENLQQKIQQR